MCPERNLKAFASIAQLDRAFDYGSKGCGFDSYWTRHMYREIVQLGRAPGLGPGGCRFKSCFPDHRNLKVFEI